MGGLGVIIEFNLNRVRLSCCWVGVGLCCDNISLDALEVGYSNSMVILNP